MKARLLDLRRSARSLYRTPELSVAAIITLLLAIGVNSAVFSVVECALLRPVPVEGLERVVQLETSIPGVAEHLPMAPAEVYDMREHRDVFDALGGYRVQPLNLTGSGAPLRITAISTVGSLFEVFRVRPFLGRLYDSTNTHTGNTNVAVLTHDFWRALTGGDRGAIGRVLQLNDSSFTVIGVLPPGLRYPQGVDLWTPHPFYPGLDSRATRPYKLLITLGRLRVGVTPPQLRRQLDADMQSWRERFPDFYAPPQQAPNAPLQVISTLTLREAIAGQLRPVILLLVGAVTLILVIACANIGSLLLVRTTGRSREIAIRFALGANRAVIVREVARDTAVLAVIGATAGVAVAALLLAIVRRSGVEQYPVLRYVAMDSRVLVASVALTLLTAILFTVAPALRAARVDASDALRSSAARTSAGIRRSQFLRGAVIVQQALALVLLLGAFVAVGSLDRLLRVNPGFHTPDIIRMRVGLPSARYSERRAREAFHDRLLSRIRALPGVIAAGATNASPFSDLSEDDNSRMLAVPGSEQFGALRFVHVSVWTVDANYFDAMGIPLLAGRTFRPGDPNDSATVILDSVLARELFGERNPVGQHLLWDVDAPTVIGIVGPIKKADLAHPDKPSLYWSTNKYALAYPTVIVRTTLPLRTEAPFLRAAVREIDSELPVFDLMTMDDGITRSLGPRALGSRVLEILAALAAVLAAFGIYGLLSYSTAERTREMGIRLALGARPAQIVALVLRAVALLTLIGATLGLAMFLAADRMLASVVYGVSPNDRETILYGVSLLTVIALAGSSVPALRAIRVHPMEALRHE